MKKRFAKTVALVVAAALTAGAPVSVMAAEEQSETVAVQEVSAPELSQGTDPMTLHGMQQLNDGNWYYMEHGKVSDKANGTLQPVGMSGCMLAGTVWTIPTPVCVPTKQEPGMLRKEKYNLIIPVWSVRERTTGRTGTM